MRFSFVYLEEFFVRMIFICKVLISSLIIHKLSHVNENWNAYENSVENTKHSLSNNSHVNVNNYLFINLIISISECDDKLTGAR